MTLAFHVSNVLSVVAFLVYGVQCVCTDRMVSEFERYGLPRLRRLTGGLEVAGALGLVAGYGYSPLWVAAAGGLALMMVAALLARVRVGDPFSQMLPALVLLLLNVFVGGYALRGMLER